MAEDEKLTTEAEEIVAEAEEQIEEQAGEATEELEQVEEAAEEQLTQLAEDVEATEEKVEAAVQHVAEEAEADALAAEEALAQDDALEEELTAKKKRERRSKQARAEKAAKAGDGLEAAAAPKASITDKLATLGVPAWLGIAAACLVLGLILGRFVLGGSAAGGIKLNGKTTVSEAELDSTFASYTYNGKNNTISVREVIEQNGTIEASKTEDGTYTLPSAEYAVNAARTAILNSEVDARGITVSDEDIAAYAEEALGTSDYDAIASTYGMDADAVKDLITENCRLNALREEIVGGKAPTMPESPAEAEEGKEDEATKDYADYIIKLAGDEWDAEKGTWAKEDSAYATALADYKVTKDGASYNAAQAAYYVAYQVYTEKSNEATTAWNDFLNDLMSKASIQVGTLVL